MTPSDAAICYSTLKALLLLTYLKQQSEFKMNGARMMSGEEENEHRGSVGVLGRGVVGCCFLSRKHTQDIEYVLSYLDNTLIKTISNNLIE